MFSAKRKKACISVPIDEGYALHLADNANLRLSGVMLFDRVPGNFMEKRCFIGSDCDKAQIDGGN